MSTRGNYYDRPSPREWGPPPAWEPYGDYGMPPRQAPPPPHYDDYDLPPDNYFDRPPPPRFYEEEPTFGEYNRTAPPHRAALHSKRGGPPVRGRGRGQNGGGRGQSYSRGRGMGHSFNSPKPPTVKDEKPAWLSQPKTTTQADTSSSNSSFSKPSWLSQSTASTASPGSSSSKPPWLAQSPVGTASSNASSSKPSWMTQSVNKTTTMSNSNNSKPSWLTQSKAPTNNVKTKFSSKPAWLSQRTQTNPKQATRFTPNQQAFTRANDSNDSFAPPPPPSYPPPSNQPKIPPQQPFTVPPGQNSTMQSKANKKVKSKLLKANVEVKVATPGENNFISFKNTLQEYCQKKGFPVPSYKSFKSSYGYLATVELSHGKSVKTSTIQKDKKDAEQYAAYEALVNLGIVAAATPFTAPPRIGAKRPMPTSQAVAKKLKGEAPPTPNNIATYKCQLNEFCQRFHLPVPTYETAASDGGGFITTLVYNKKAYQSTAPQATKRDAEQNVAQLVLSKVNQAPPPTEPRTGPIIYPNFVVGSTLNTEGTANNVAVEEDKPESNTTVIPVSSVQDLTDKYVVPVISYKNKLQEVCQKQKSDLPVYDSSRDDKLYSCKVTIQSQVFSATGCKTKKGSEQSAARVALQALGLLTE